MSGSVRERRPGVWELRVYAGRDPSGRVRHRHTTFVGSKRAAGAELARLVAEQDRSPVMVADSECRAWGPATTINDAIAGWRDNGWQDLSPTTTRRYESLWKVHIAPGIGRRKIASLGPYDIERWFRSLKAGGLSEASVRQARAMLHRACRLARKWSGNQLPNPVADTELPDWSLEERALDVRSPSAAEVQRLLDAAGRYDTRVAAFIRLVAATGVRRGEACAVRWSDVDWESEIVRFDEAIVATNGGTRVRVPKTRASVRLLAIDSGTLDQLCGLRAERVALADTCATSLGPNAFVFSVAPDGTERPNPDSMSHAFARVRALAGVASDVHLHSLRHFQSTELDAVISEAQKQARLGWATVHMARHYTGTVTEEDRRAAQHMGRLLG